MTDDLDLAIWGIPQENDRLRKLLWQKRPQLVKAIELWDALEERHPQQIVHQVLEPLRRSAEEAWTAHRNEYGTKVERDGQAESWALAENPPAYLEGLVESLSEKQAGWYAQVGWVLQLYLLGWGNWDLSPESGKLRRTPGGGTPMPRWLFSEPPARFDVYPPQAVPTIPISHLTQWVPPPSPNLSVQGPGAVTILYALWKTALETEAKRLHAEDRSAQAQEVLKSPEPRWWVVKPGVGRWPWRGWPQFAEGSTIGIRQELVTAVWDALGRPPHARRGTREEVAPYVAPSFPELEDVRARDDEGRDTPLRNALKNADYPQ